MDQHKPRTLSPPTSGNTFWQIEAESGILNGNHYLTDKFKLYELIDKLQYNKELINMISRLLYILLKFFKFCMISFAI